jgi:hypothetical protein
MADQREHCNLALKKRKEEEEEEEEEEANPAVEEQHGKEEEEEAEDGLGMPERMQKRGQMKSFLAI